jgi:acetolactate synthase small subunit
MNFQKETIELEVRDHIGTAFQVCALLHRRGWKADRLLYSGDTMLIEFSPGIRLDQAVKQLENLEDVRKVRILEPVDKFTSLQVAGV